jgi:hypothetical protein
MNLSSHDGSHGDTATGPGETLARNVAQRLA